VIVMLCDLIESGKPKCEQYWPSDGGSKLKFGDLRISLVSEVKERDHFVIRTLRLKRKSSGEKERIIFQFQYFGWPDHGTPDEIAPLLEFVNRLRDYQPVDLLSPLVVHCSAGCGRTGTICALDYVRTLIKSKRVPPDFTICNVVTELRKQRPAMVQSKEQYMLLHRAIALMFEHELDTTKTNHLQVNVSDVMISSPPLTPAPPIPVDDSSNAKRNLLPAPLVSLSPTLSSETSATSASDDASSTGNPVLDEQKPPNVVNGFGPKAKSTRDDDVTAVSCNSGEEVVDTSSVTSYETVSTTKTGRLSANEDEEPGNKNNAVTFFSDADRKAEAACDTGLSGQKDSKSLPDRSSIAEPHSVCPPAARIPDSTYSSHETSKAGAHFSGNTIPGFPDKLTERPLGAKNPPSSWPDQEEVLNRIQRL